MSVTKDQVSRVEQPLMRQLGQLGWQTLEGDPHVPPFSGRARFEEVLLKERLRRALVRINQEEGQPWLDAPRLAGIIQRLERVRAPHLMDANQAGTTLLLDGLAVEGDLETEGRRRKVQLIDWEHPANNDFLAVHPFRVDVPGRRSYILPSVVLFVNGIPLVVIECRGPTSSNPIETAIQQLIRYTKRREENDKAGVEKLFVFNQLLIATCFEQARLGTLGASLEHYLEWKDTAPEAGGERGSRSPQQTLVAGVLLPQNLLDIFRHFTLFQQTPDKTIKVVARYQQFRAVHAALHRLRTGQTRRQIGEVDQRGGIIWHTQGSGKSLTMVFLVRKLRSTPDLRRFKVVVVTDRSDLERQLGQTATLTGEPVQRVRDTEDLKRILRLPGPDLVFAMIQKYQDRNEPQGSLFPPSFEVLNESEDVLVLVDEAHRSHTSTLHANLLQALPNCARIGFTGTPILMGAARKTHEIFGPFLDRYTMAEAEADGATVPIRYEGWGVCYQLEDGQSLDYLFDDYFAQSSDEEREAIRSTHATRFTILEREAVIGAKAAHMLRHYIATVLPCGLKAQIVAVSRKAAVRYCEILETLHGEWLHQLNHLDPCLLDLPAGEQARLDEHTRWLIQVHPQRERLAHLQFAAIISAGPDDPLAWEAWNDPDRHRVLIDRFKKSLHHPAAARRDGLAFLCVKSMLLTGFDAPVEGVLYLDRPMRGHELLQAITRVNRPCANKNVGLIVDYCGVVRHLTEALAAYHTEDIDGVMRSLQDELPILAERHGKLLAFFQRRGVADLSDRAACVDVLGDQGLRSAFAVLLRSFFKSLDVVLPRPEGLPYVGDAQRLGRINLEARNRYRDADLRVAGAGAKVEELIDRHLRVEGIDPKVPPLAVTAPNFLAQVARQPTLRGQAGEMEHALRHHIQLRLDEDPVRYRKLSERLEHILREFENDWEQLTQQLRQLVAGLAEEDLPGVEGLQPQHMPFYRLLAEELPPEPSPSRQAQLAGVCVGLVAEISRQIGKVDFWRNPQLRNELQDQVTTYLDDHDVVPFVRQEAIAGRLVELARALHPRLTNHHD
jgi:type I restriction enzyme R subunit